MRIMVYYPDRCQNCGKSLPLKIEQVEHYDIFENDAVIFWIDVSCVSPEIQTGAYQINGNHHDPNCFGICVNYNFKRRQFYLVTDTDASAACPSNIYYTDSAGNKHWFAAKLTQPFIEQAFLACVQVVAHESLNIRPTEQEAHKSAVLEAVEYCRSAAEEESEAKI